MIVEATGLEPATPGPKPCTLPTTLRLALIKFVQMVGFEPTRLMTSDPKSDASTNFATSANE